MFKFFVRVMFVGIAGLGCFAFLQPESTSGPKSDPAIAVEASVAAEASPGTAITGTAMTSRAMTSRAMTSRAMASQARAFAAASQQTGSATEPTQASFAQSMLAQATQAMLRSTSSSAADSADTTAKHDNGQGAIADAFFRDQPHQAPAAKHASSGMLSRLKAPFGSSDSKPEYQAIDHGAEIQTNPFLTHGK